LLSLIVLNFFESSNHTLITLPIYTDIFSYDFVAFYYSIGGFK
jgi:hypothetical protein